MKTYNNLYPKIYNLGNIFTAWRKARKDKTKKFSVLEFEKDTIKNLLQLNEELKSGTYKPKPLKTFILRDPKTRKISKSDFRDRIVHHTIVNILEPIYEKIFIYDSCANRKGKGTLFALKRFEKFVKRISKNGKIKGAINKNQVKGYCLKADIKHYFQEIDHNILLKIIQKKITDKKIFSLIGKIIRTQTEERERAIFQKACPLAI